jgi:hypothetical protein
VAAGGRAGAALTTLLRPGSGTRREFADRRAALLKEGHRPAIGASDAQPLGVDPQVAEEGRQEDPDTDPPVRRVLAPPVGRADHPSPSDPTSREQ